MKFFVLFLVVFTINIGNCLSQQNKEISDSAHISTIDNTGITNRSPLVRIGSDLLHQFTGIFSIDKDNIMPVLSGIALAGTLFATDQGSYNTIRRFKKNNKWMRQASPYISGLGSQYGIGIIGLFAGIGFFTHNSKMLETSYLAAESFLTSGIWIRTLKLVTGRERPSATNQHSHKSGGLWSGPLPFFHTKNNGRSPSSYDAFPSGHTGSAFSIATVFANQYHDNLIVPIISYSLASLVGIARIVEDTHWASDVFVGAVIGYLSSIQILKSNPSELSRRAYQKEFTIKEKKIERKFSYGLNPVEKSLYLSYSF